MQKYAEFLHKMNFAKKFWTTQENDFKQIFIYM